MLIKLWVEGYIIFHFSAGMYQTYVVSFSPWSKTPLSVTLILGVAFQYVSASPKAGRITRFSIEEVEQGGLPFELTMELHGPAKGKKASKATKTGTAKRKAGGGAGGAPKRAKVGVATTTEEDEEDVPEFVFEDEGDEEDPEVTFERFRAGEIGNLSSGWNSDGQGGIELDSD